MISVSDKKRLDIFKMRTVLNGNTKAEEDEAKKQIDKIMEKYKDEYEKDPYNGWVPKISYIQQNPNVNPNPFVYTYTQQNPNGNPNSYNPSYNNPNSYHTQEKKSYNTQYTYSESDFYTQQMKKREEEAKRKQQMEEERRQEELRKRAAVFFEQEEKRKQEEKKKTEHIKCPNCGCETFYTKNSYLYLFLSNIKKKDKYNEPLCSNCFKIFSVKTDGYNETDYCKDIEDIEELKIYFENIYAAYKVLDDSKRFFIYSIMKRSPLLQRVKFKIGYFLWHIKTFFELILDF